MCLINENKILKIILFLSFVVINASGCTFLNMLPNSLRDEWYIENATDLSEGLDFLNMAKIGFTKEKVIEVWGEPWKKKGENIWTYKFPKYFSNTILIKFENGKFSKQWSSIW